jgi:hypothetical protein
MSTPAIVDKTVYLATDDVWSFRKLVDGERVIPTTAKAQIRDTFGGVIWLDATVTIDNDGWVDIHLPKEKVVLSDWQGRFTGVWDLYITVDDETERLVMGTVEVNRNVTI